MNKLSKIIITFAFVFITVIAVKGSDADASTLYYIGSDFTNDKSTVIAKSENTYKDVPYSLKAFNSDYEKLLKEKTLYYKDFYKSDIPSGYNDYISFSISENLVNGNIFENDTMNNKGLAISVINNGTDYLGNENNIADYIAGVLSMKTSSVVEAKELLNQIIESNTDIIAFDVLLADQKEALLIKVSVDGSLTETQLTSDMAFAINNDGSREDGKQEYSINLSTKEIIEILRGDDGDFNYQTFFKIHSDLPAEMSIEEWLCLGSSKYATFVPLTNASESLNDNYEYQVKSNSFSDNLISFLFKSLNSAGSLSKELGKAIGSYWSFIENINVSRFDLAYKDALDVYNNDSAQKAKYYLTTFAKSIASNVYDDSYRMFCDINDSINNDSLDYMPYVKLSQIATYFGFEYQFDKANKVFTISKGDKTFVFNSSDGFKSGAANMIFGEDSSEIRVVFDGTNLLIPYEIAKADIIESDEPVVNQNEYLDSYVIASSESNIPIFVFFGLLALIAIVFVAIILLRKKKKNTN